METIWDGRKRLAQLVRSGGSLPRYRVGLDGSGAGGWGIVGFGAGHLLVEDRVVDAVHMVAAGRVDEEAARAFLREHANGLPTRLVVANRGPELAAEGPRLRRRLSRLRPGASISCGLNSTHGSIGCFVTDRTPGKQAIQDPYILSAAHVCSIASARLNRDHDRNAVSTIYQPGWRAKVEQDNRVGTITRCGDVVGVNAGPSIDAAIARLSGQRSYRAHPKNTKWSTTPGDANQSPHPVAKTGSHTGLTDGGFIVYPAFSKTIEVDRDETGQHPLLIDTDDLFVIVNEAPVSPQRRALFDYHIHERPGIPDFGRAVNPRKPFARAGDSGSVVIDAQGRPLGIIFAVDPGLVYCHPIRTVLEELREGPPLRIIGKSRR